MAKSKFYKGKYLIAIYDEDDYPFIIADNVKELAKITGKKIDILQSSISHQTKGIVLNGRRYRIYLIPIKEEK